MTDERRRAAGRRSDDVTLGEVWRLLGEIKDDLQELLAQSIVYRLGELEKWKSDHTKLHEDARKELAAGRSFWARESVKWVLTIVGAVLGALILSYLQGRTP